MQVRVLQNVSLPGHCEAAVQLPVPRPGEPISFASPDATNAPLAPVTLSVAITGTGSVAEPAPAWLSKVANGAAPGEAPKPTPVTRVPALLNRTTSSAVLLRPTPAPV